MLVFSPHAADVLRHSKEINFFFDIEEYNKILTQA